MAFGRKRSHDETRFPKEHGNFAFGSTLDSIKKQRLSNDNVHVHQQVPAARSFQQNMNTSPSNETGEWQVAESKASRKRKRKQEIQDENVAEGPSLRFSQKIEQPLRVKDLQDLVLYTLSDGIAPTWLAVRNVRKIERAVVMMVPGLKRNMLESLVDNISQNEAKPDSLATEETNITKGIDNITSNAKKTDHSLSKSSLTESIVPVKAPGDTKQAKVHSPLQAMLIAPTEDSKDKKNGRNGNEKQFQPIRTPLINFIHTADELREAEYPIHPAIFTNRVDGNLEKHRRESTGQSCTTGWVDTPVESSAPILPDSSEKKRDFVTQGCHVYALDCEMVVTSDDVSSLARISLLDWFGKVVIDKYVKPSLPVKNYFTQYSGITPEILANVTTTLTDVQQELLKILTPSTIILGHSLESDLNALKLTHPFIVDTSMIYPHPRGLPLRSSLKFLANKYLKREIQIQGANGHDSVEDARAVLDLVRLKCEKGPKWGTTEVNGESIFRRLARSGKTSAIVEYGTPEKGFGKDASISVGCQNDEEVVDGIIRTVNGNESAEAVKFVWGRLRDLESARAENADKDQSQLPDVPSEESQTQPTTSMQSRSDQSTLTPETTIASSNGEVHLNTATNSSFYISQPSQESLANKVTSHLFQIYTSLPPQTLFILYSGTGDMSPVLRLQSLQQQFRKEFKVKKWDELSVKWTDTEEQALRNAVEVARRGIGFVCVT